jgi:hypothetical protein
MRTCVKGFAVARNSILPGSSKNARITMKQNEQNFLEWSFLLSRIVICYAGMIVFLALPPVTKFTQELALFLQQFFPSLTVPALISPSMRAEATQQALSMFWLGGTPSSVFTKSEYQHLQDVHWLLVVSGVVVGCAVGWAVLSERYTARLWIARTYRRIAVAVSCSTVVVVLCFNPLFTFFHQLFFPQGNFSFPVESLLIQSFPPMFWLLSAVIVQVGVIVLLLLQSHHAERVGI